MTTMNTPEGLDPAALYTTPRGRFCRLEHLNRTIRSGDDAVAHFVYVNARGEPLRAGLSPDGFPLTRANWRILLRVR